MSSLADLPELIGFFSYSREDDEDSHGALSALRERIQRELRGQLGRSMKTFRLWQDKEAIASGTLWEAEIKTAAEQSVFFIPIITPTVVRSPYCRFELDSFLAREAALGRSDLVFPILYIKVPALEDSIQRENDPVLSIIAKRQYLDWREFRHRDVASTDVKEAVERFCAHICDALHRPWLPMEERQRRDEAEARRRAQEEQRQREDERRRETAAEAERQRLEREAAATREAEERARQAAVAEAERQCQVRDAAATREAEEKARHEEHRKKEEDERRRNEAEAKRRSEAARALGAAKRADTVSAVDAFLATHPESHLAGEARALRAMLLARDDAHKGAMTSDDPAVLKAFLKDYPKGTQVDEVRRRLRRLEPQPVWRPSRRALAAGSLISVAVLVAIGVWLFRAPAPGVVSALSLSPEQERAPKPKDTFKECTNCPQMIVVPAGGFMMGSPVSESGRKDDEGPQHRVTIAKPFAVSTFDEWDACVADGGCNGYKPNDQGWGRGHQPVIDVSWYDAKAYVAWLSTKSGKSYRLLSEAEYEYAARSGTQTAYPWGNVIGTGNTNCKGCGSHWDDKQTAPVGSFAPNGFGLYDMIGNVSEWVEDCPHYDYSDAPRDGSAWTSSNCDLRMGRGGSYVHLPVNLRSAARDEYVTVMRFIPTDERLSYLGFRVGRTLLAP